MYKNYPFYQFALISGGAVISTDIYFSADGQTAWVVAPFIGIYSLAIQDVDCDGTLHGSAELDDCGVCGGENEDKDSCGVCFGNNSTCVDCLGVVNGGAVVDNCGVCGGDDSTCCWNYLGVENDLWDFILTPKAVGDLIERLEKTYAVVDYIYENIPELEELPETVTDDEICLLSELNRIFLEGNKWNSKLINC